MCDWQPWSECYVAVPLLIQLVPAWPVLLGPAPGVWKEASAAVPQPGAGSAQPSQPAAPSDSQQPEGSEAEVDAPKPAQAEPELDPFYVGSTWALGVAAMVGVISLVLWNSFHELESSEQKSGQAVAMPAKHRRLGKRGQPVRPAVPLKKRTVASQMDPSEFDALLAEFAEERVEDQTTEQCDSNPEPNKGRRAALATETFYIGESDRSLDEPETLGQRTGGPHPRAQSESPELLAPPAGRQAEGAKAAGGIVAQPRPDHEVMQDDFWQASECTAGGPEGGVTRSTNVTAVDPKGSTSSMGMQLMVSLDGDLFPRS